MYPTYVYLYKGQHGIRVTDRERNAFVEWYANHRCRRGSPRWDFAQSTRFRTLHGVDLEEFLNVDLSFEITTSERTALTAGGHEALIALLEIIDQIIKGVWPHVVGSHEAHAWRPSDKRRAMEPVVAEQSLLDQPFQTSSFGLDAKVQFVRLR